MKKLLPFALLVLVYACTPSPEPIRYGEALCHWCKMTIVDRQHAAEAVTRKGRVFFFDAIECMMQFLDDADNEEDFALLLVNDFSRPGELIDAQTATYLVSEQIPSPMGAFLSAFAERREAQTLQQARGGTIYDWREARNYVRSR